MESNIGKNIGIKNGIKYWNKNGILKMESIPRINIGIQCLETNLYSYTEKTILYSFFKKLVRLFSECFKGWFSELEPNALIYFLK